MILLNLSSQVNGQNFVMYSFLKQYLAGKMGLSIDTDFLTLSLLTENSSGELICAWYEV
jgi:hypothetical protein